MGAFNRGSNQTKESNHTRGRNSESFNESEPEPEWFTEGPDSVNDTLELGMTIDDEGEFKSFDNPSPLSKGGTSITNPSEVDAAIVSIDKDAKSLDFTDADLSDLLKVPVKKSNGQSILMKLLENQNRNSPSPKNTSPTCNQDNTQLVFNFPSNVDNKPSTSVNSCSEIGRHPSQPSRKRLFIRHFQIIHIHIFYR